MNPNDNPDPSGHFEIPVVPPLWSRVLHLIADRNPFYLISAVCMLAGCLAMTNSLSWLSLPLQRLLILIATINVYEAVLIGLSLLLIGRGLIRDGKILLILEAFFLVDVTFLNAEVVTANLRLGIFISIVLFIFAVIKLRLVIRALGAELPPARFVYVIVQIAGLLTIPCVLRGIDHGSVSAGNFYAVWWIVGLLPVIGEICLAVWGEGHVSKLSGVATVFVSLPLISLVAHIGILHYVYDVEYFGAMASPMLLGFAIVLKRATSASRDVRQQITAIRFLLPLAAIIVSLSNPHVLTLSVLHTTVTPTLLSMSGAYLTYIYCFMMPLAGWLITLGAMVATTYLFGPSLESIERFLWKWWVWADDAIDWMVPKTLTGWGVVSVLASFFFLLLGAAVSLSKPRLALDEVDRNSV